jgi:putative nucleotidyltransferase with HDIG domain
MEKLAKLEQKVKELYDGDNPNRAEWASWLAENHVFVVADYATDLAKKYKANVELTRAAALLHDIADVKMKRDDKTHEEESLRMARELMQEAGYDEDNVRLVVDDAIRYHSCHGDERPVSIEGKILATADSLAHLKTDFYVFATWALGRESTLEEIKSWVLKKIDRDLNNKILFDDERKDATPDYNLVKELFSR